MSQKDWGTLPYWRRKINITKYNAWSCIKSWILERSVAINNDVGTVDEIWTQYGLDNTVYPDFDNYAVVM